MFDPSRKPAARGRVPSTLSFALLFAAATLSALAPLARGAADARLGGRAGTLFTCFASGTSSQPDALPGRPDSRHDRGNMSCAFCAACGGGDAPLLARSGFVGAAPIQSFKLNWMVADCAAPTPRRNLSHRPRAPPADFA